MSADGFKVARQYFAYFNQGEQWVPDGKPPVRIVDMDPAWRHNAARFLIRNAGAYLFRYDLGELSTIWDGGFLAPSVGSQADRDLDEEIDLAQTQRAGDPATWMRSTVLYQALVDGLPDNVADLARHWSDCGVRLEGGACTCWRRHVPECPKREDIAAGCRCRDFSPEWTL
jgi:hypothetical protein